MPAQYGGSTVAYLNNGQQANLALPGGTTNGDCLFAFCSQGGKLSDPSRWNFLGDNIYQRVAMSEPSFLSVQAADLSSYNANGKGAVIFVRYTKSDNANPLLAYDSTYAFGDIDNIVDVPALGAIATGGLTFSIVAATYSSVVTGATSPPAEWTLRASFNQDPQGGGLVRIYDSPENVSGFSVNLTTTSTLTDTGFSASILGGAAGGFFY